MKNLDFQIKNNSNKFNNILVFILSILLSICSMVDLISTLLKSNLIVNYLWINLRFLKIVIINFKSSLLNIMCYPIIIL